MSPALAPSLPSLLAPLGLAWALMAALMAVVWLIQRARRDAGVVDVAWAGGLGALAVLLAVAAHDAPLARRLLVGGLGGFWGFRLALHLLRDRVLGKEEDARYRALRAAWGRHAQRNLFVFFQLQAASQALLALPWVVLLAHRGPAPTAWELAGLALGLLAVAGEGIADRQLAAFRADPANRGRTCRRGLWGWSRHPNYFFEWLHWWGYVVMSVGAPFAWLTLVAPAAMFHVLWNVTGIPLTEQRALVTRGDDYRHYQRTVSAFVPLPPRRP